MSQVTRCPACGTSFRVVPDQLRISQGWVRCGQCAEIFDASLELRDPNAAPVPTQLRPQSTEPPPYADGPADHRSHVPAEPDAPAWPEAGTGETPVRGAPAPTLVDLAPQWLQSAPPDIPVTDPAASLDVGFAEYRQTQVQAEETALPQAGTAPRAAGLAAQAAPAAPADPADAALPQPSIGTPGAGRLYVALTPETTAKGGAAAPGAGAMPLPRRPAAEPSTPTVGRSAESYRPARAAPAVDPVHAELSFLREAPVAAAAPARMVRKPLWFGLLAVAMLLLLMQWALHERDRLAATAPALRPVLQALCAPLQCTVQPLRRIDAIVIDGSAFVALGEQGEQGYRLSLTLRNRASHAVALPAVVLALTDIQEQAVVRRVLLPTELGDPPPALPAHGEWSTSVDLKLADNAGRARVVGYRLDAFYP